MTQFNLDETTIRHGVRCIFGIAAGILALMLTEIADDFLTGIVFGISTGIGGLILAVMLRQVGTIPLGVAAIIHGMDDDGFHPGGYHRMHPLMDDLGEALLLVFVAGSSMPWCRAAAACWQECDRTSSEVQERAASSPS